MSWIMTKRGSQDNIITYEHYCDTFSDLSNIPSSQVTLGSTAVVINDEDDGLGIYMANSQKEWVPISTSIGGGSGEITLDLIHICSSSEYDSVTKVPTIEDAETNKIYLVPNSESGNNVFDEWIYADETWEKFGGGSINVSVTDVQVNGTSVLNAQNIANIPVADNNNLGVVRPAAKTNAMTQGVGVDSNGALWTEPAPTNPIASNGIPSGGTTGQILKKSSNTDYAAGWSNNTLSGLSDVFTQLATYNSILMYNPSASQWETKTVNEDAMYFGDDGEGHVVLYASEGEIERRFWYGIPFYAHGQLDGVTYCQLHFLMRKPEFDERDMLLRETVYFINFTTSTPYNLDIVRFVGEWFEDVGWQYRYQPAAAITHEVSHTWIGTQAEYTALGTYDPNTIYYIRGDVV